MEILEGCSSNCLNFVFMYLYNSNKINSICYKKLSKNVKCILKSGSLDHITLSSLVKDNEKCFLSQRPVFQNGLFLDEWVSFLPTNSTNWPVSASGSKSLVHFNSVSVQQILNDTYCVPSSVLAPRDGIWGKNKTKQCLDSTY